MSGIVLNLNEELINNFYTCFQNKDYKGMQTCYAYNAVFNDAVFLNIKCSQVSAMWEMFCKKGKDLRIEFMNVSNDEKQGMLNG